MGPFIKKRNCCLLLLTVLAFSPVQSQHQNSGSADLSQKVVITSRQDAESAHTVGEEFTGEL